MTDFPALKVVQGGQTLFVFKARASALWPLIEITKRDPDKQEGYQRALSPSRVKAVKRYIEAGNPMPGAIAVNFDNAKFDETTAVLSVDTSEGLGWVIDGQHRFAGAHEAALAGTDLELIVVCFVGLELKDQVRQFIVINQEARGVPTSLLLDLLKHIPSTNPQEQARDRATDLGQALDRDESSPFFDRIVVLSKPRNGEVSLANFVRKVQPLVHPDTGLLRGYAMIQQHRILSNYFKTINNVFVEQTRKLKPIQYTTIGFGAFMNVMPVIFQRVRDAKGGFTIEDITSLMEPLAGFDFSPWEQYGTGNKAEVQAGKDFEAAFLLAMQQQADAGEVQDLRL